MSQKPNPTSIGLFIVIGVGLIVIGLLLFGSGKIFTKTHELIVYFDESLLGLDEGARVKYRGVTIGTVKQVMVRFNQAERDYAMPVIIELKDQLIRDRLGEPAQTFSEKIIRLRVYGGLRASLQTESLVTGTLCVDISPDPHAPEAHFHQLEKIYPEVPSEPSQIQQLFNDLATLDIKSMGTNINNLVTKVDEVLSGLRVGAVVTEATNTLASVNRLLASPEITNSLALLPTTLEQYRLLGEKLNGRIDPLAESITNSLAEANHTLAQLRGTADNLRGMLRPDAPLEHDLEELLQQLAGTAESLSTFMEFLKQHPNALLTGREASPKP